MHFLSYLKSLFRGPKDQDIRLSFQWGGHHVSLIIYAINSLLHLCIALCIELTTRIKC